MSAAARGATKEHQTSSAKGSAARRAQAAKSHSAKRTAAVLGGGKRGPAKAGDEGESDEPVGDKNSGPCTRHVHRDGHGHDYHKGYGWGHYGKPASVRPPKDDDGSPAPPLPGGDGDTQPPADNPSPTPIPIGTPAGNGPGGSKAPWLPFTPVAFTSSKRKSSDSTAERYLPFTGSEPSWLLAAAALAAFLGAALRGGAGARLHAYRRIAR